jgi:hypothetical protein
MIIAGSIIFVFAFLLSLTAKVLLAKNLSCANYYTTSIWARKNGHRYLNISFSDASYNCKVALDTGRTKNFGDIISRTTYIGEGWWHILLYHHQKAFLIYLNSETFFA